jgi:hypothetical protein
MKSRVMIGFLLVMLSLAGQGIAAESCQDEQGMAQGEVQTATEMVDTVKKESQAEFESKFHQKSTANKLTFAISALDDLVQCLDKASQGGDPAAATAKDSEARLRDRLTQYRDSLKSTEDPKKAKALIETFDLSSK